MSGIYAEADTAVSGNVVENAKAIGIAIGWGRYLRNVAVTGKVWCERPRSGLRCRSSTAPDRR